MTELRTLRWGDEPGLSAWARYKHKCPYNSKAGEPETQKRGGGGRGDDGSRSQREESEGVVLLALKMEEGAVSQGLQVPLEAGNGENSNSTLEPPEGMQACKHPVRTILRL